MAIFRVLFTAQVVALLGTGLATVALGLLAHDLAGEQAAQVLGSALVVKMVAYVTVSPLVGALAERVPRRRLMIGADLVRAGVVVALPVVDRVWQVLVLVAVLQTAAAVFTPTFQSVIGDVVPGERDYGRALSWSQTAVSLENIASPLLAAAALTVVRFDALFVATAVGFGVSAVLVARTRVPVARRSARTRFTERLTAGTRIFLATPRLRAVLALDLAVAAAGAITVVGTVTVVRDLLGGTDGDVALLLAVSGAGTALAALCVPALLRRLTERTVLLGGAAALAVGAAGAIGAAQVAQWWAVLLAWPAIGAGGGLVAVPIGTVLRRSSGDADRPAVYAARFSLSHLCWLLTYAVAGWVSAAAGITVSWTVLALLAAVAVVAAALLWPRGLPDTVRHGHPAEADHEHVGGAEWDGGRWVHTHRLVIDPQHPRWPAAAR